MLQFHCISLYFSISSDKFCILFVLHPEFLWISISKFELQFCILFATLVQNQQKFRKLMVMHSPFNSEQPCNKLQCRKQTRRIWVSCCAIWLMAMKMLRQSKAGIPAGRLDSGPLNRKLLISAVDRLVSSNLWSRTTARTGFFRRPCKTQNTFTGLNNTTDVCSSVHTTCKTMVVTNQAFSSLHLITITQEHSCSFY